ncbi:FecR family protein [Larkinella arboricola]|uniref:FecR family protein n=1 Tax=Larkinella arboricola TaxID=643671 RepID=A0A327WV84_LARAB|nr:FecR domain-containing protein [Larkinella arboricola]RAJ95641.1 FecR family protein [Larkinella arboricola]
MNATQIARYLARELSEDEAQTLLRWVEESPDNKRLFIQIKNAWSMASMDKVDATDVEYTRQRWQLVKRQLDQQTIRPLETTPWRWLRVAAAVLLVTGLAFLAYFNQNRLQPEISYQIVETPAGKRSRIVLPDQSVVWLNARSKLRYPTRFDSRKREVKLEGEAFFEVQSSPDKPFFVQTDRTTVRVTGTAFNVYAYPSESEQRVILVRGQVAVSHAGSRHFSILKPGFSATVRKTSDPIVIQAVDATEHTGWTTGKLEFKHLAFEDIARRLERTFNIHIIFSNPKYRQETFSGSFDENEPLEEILQVIQASSDFEYSIRKDTLLIR